MKIDLASNPSALALIQTLVDMGLVRLDSDQQARRMLSEQEEWQRNHEAEYAFLKILVEALGKIPSDYFSNIYDFNSAIGEYESRNGTFTDRERESLREHLKKYDERVFCYELYHRLRNLMDYRFDGLRLQSEVRKLSVDPIIENILKVKKLSKEYQPDFLLHSPAVSSKQIAIMEVKTNPNLTFKGAQKDLSKLQEFIVKYNFRIGVFLAVNVDKIRLSNSIMTQSSREWIRGEITAANSIYIVCKERAGSTYSMHRLSEMC